MLRCLFFGLGSIGQRHVRNLRALLGDEVELHAYRVRGEPDVLNERMQIEPGVDLAAKYSIQIHSDIDQAFASKPDVTFVTNPTSLHVPTARRAAELGSDLFIEKPVSSDLEGIDELARIVSERKLVAYVGYQMRQHPAFRRVQTLLKAQTLGKLCAVNVEIGEYLPGFHPYEDYRRSYASRRELGGGVTVTQIHELDLIYALFGMPERVFSLGGRLSELEIDVDDVASSLCEFRRPDGRLLPVHVHQDYLQRPPTRSFRIIGTRGRIDWNLSSATFERYGELGELVESVSYKDYPRNQLFLDELSQFLHCVRERRSPELGVLEGAASLEIALALRESQSSGLPVRLGKRSAP